MSQVPAFVKERKFNLNCPFFRNRPEKIQNYGQIASIRVTNFIHDPILLDSHST
jgi:hypothetical protein